MCIRDSLYALTQKTAKPAVSFGGKYRIVDFPLSNCVNSNIDTVGIATQYQPQKPVSYTHLNDALRREVPVDGGAVHDLVEHRCFVPPLQAAFGGEHHLVPVSYTHLPRA